MTMFDDLFSSVGFPILGDKFGEPAEYLYRVGTVACFTSGVIVYRNPPEMVSEKGEVYQPMFLVEVPIDPRLVDTGGDRIKIKEHATDTETKTYAVKRLISQIGLNAYIEVG